MFLLSSTWGRLFRLTVSATGPKKHCLTSVISDNKTLLSRVTLGLFSSSAPAQKTQTAAIAIDRLSIPNGTIVWALTSYRIQRWMLVSDGWDEACPC